MDRFHLLITVVHTVGAIGSYIMSMYCEVLPATQRAMIPAAIHVSMHNATTAASRTQVNISEVQAYRAAFPWSEDAVFHTHLWNPYLLIVAFEWLTAAFAMCNLCRWWPEVKIWSLVWVALGLILIVMWLIRHYVLETEAPKQEEFATAMTVTLILSYFATAALCYMYLLKTCPSSKAQQGGDDKKDTNNPSDGNPDEAGDAESRNPEDPATAQSLLTVTRRVVVQGRLWRVPQRVGYLKVNAAPLTGTTGGGTKGYEGIMLEDDVSMRSFHTAVYEVFFRYIEYCITAPLLFLAVMCLLTVDAPAWLFLFGYWLIQACNVLGIAYHATICTDLLRDYTNEEQARTQGGSGTNNAKASGTGSPLEWFKGVLANGSWGDRGMQHVYLLQASWLCLALPIGGLVYMTRAWLFAQDQNMPWIALAMVWLLLIAYSMFGLIPTAVYSFYRRDLIQKLPWMLDLLNLLAKFPVPILILIAFSTRPSGFHTCSASS